MEIYFPTTLLSDSILVFGRVDNLKHRPANLWFLESLILKFDLHPIRSELDDDANGCQDGSDGKHVQIPVNTHGFMWFPGIYLVKPKFCQKKSTESGPPKRLKRLGRVSHWTWMCWRKWMWPMTSLAFWLQGIKTWEPWGGPSRRLLALTQQKKHGHIRKQFYNEELRVSSLSLSFCKGRVRFFW